MFWGRSKARLYPIGPISSSYKDPDKALDRSHQDAGHAFQTPAIRPTSGGLFFR